MTDYTQNRMIREMMSGGIGMSVASVLLNPLDVVKVRIQHSPNSYRGVIDCGRISINMAGGIIRGLWMPGLSATMIRDILNGSFRVGLYKEVERTLFPLDSTVPIVVRKVVTGVVVGSSAGIWSPTDLIKTRMQIQLYEKPKYSSFFDAFRKIFNSEGLVGLYRGLCPNLLRASLITTSHVSSYDFAKNVLAENNVNESVVSWTFCGFLSALVTTTMSAPVDLVRTRVMAGLVSSPGSVSVAKDILSTEGVRGLFRGWLPSFYRFGPHFTISWPLIELARTRIFNLDSF